jgi:hypothetical protein
MNKNLKESFIELEKDFSIATETDVNSDIMIDYMLNLRDRYFVYGFIIGVLITNIIL